MTLRVSPAPTSPWNPGLYVRCLLRLPTSHTEFCPASALYLFHSLRPVMEASSLVAQGLSCAIVLEPFCYRPGFLASFNRNWSEARQEIQARLYWGPCCGGGEWEPATGSLLGCSLRARGQAGSLYGMRVGVCPKGWLRWLTHAFGGAVCGWHAQCSATAPGS